MQIGSWISHQLHLMVLTVISPDGVIHPCRKQRHRVSGSAVTTEFLQQARLGKDKATAGGSGIEKIVGAKASSALPLDGIRQRERDRAKEGNDRLPMHLEVHTLGLSTGLRRVLYRQEKKPKAALRQPERSIRQEPFSRVAIPQHHGPVIWDSTKEIEMEAKRTHSHGCCADKSCTDKTCMELPKGETCGSCVHERRCCTIFGHNPTDTYCDWFPRRFLAKATQ